MRRQNPPLRSGNRPVERRGLGALRGSDAVTPGRNPDTAFGIPADTFGMQGHDGQSAGVIRSRPVVVVRLGLTPARHHYPPQPRVKALLDARRRGEPGAAATD